MEFGHLFSSFESSIQYIIKCDYNNFKSLLVSLFVLDNFVLLIYVYKSNKCLILFLELCLFQ